MVDNPRQVTYTAERGGVDVSDVLTAFPEIIRVAEKSPTAGVYLGFERVFHVPQVFLDPLVSQGRDFKPGDRITDDAGAVWTVLRARQTTEQAWWLFETVNLKLALDLKDSVTFLAPDNAQDAAGSRAPKHYTPQGGAYDARIQLTGQEIQDGRGKRLWRFVYDVFLAAEVGGLTPEWRLQDAAGKIYQVVRYTNRGRIDELSRVEAERFGDSA